MVKELGRINPLQGIYSEIAFAHYLKACEFYKKEEEIKKDEAPELLFEYEKNVYKNSIVSVCFALMALECFIYDYAARNLGDSYVVDYLDGMDIMSKWIIVPKIITGKELDKSCNEYCLLKNAIGLRNHYTHNKSMDASRIFDNPLEYRNLYNKRSIIKALDHDPNSADYLHNAENGLFTIYELARWLDRIDDDAHAMFLFGLAYLQGSGYTQLDEGWYNILSKKI